MTKNNKKGFIPVMLTPFKKNGEVDYENLTRLTNFYLDSGVSGLFANCLSSEMYELSPTERLRIIEHVVRVVNGAVPVVATGSFGNTIEEQAEFTKQVYDKGVQAVIVITSLLAEPEESDTLLEKRVSQLLDLTEDIPLGFYECPVPYKRVLKPEQLGRFVDTGRVIYHKDTSLDIDSVRRKVHNANMNDFGLYDAYIGNAVASLKAGAAGLSCIQGNYFPELIVWLCNHYDDKDSAVKVQDFFLRNMHVMHFVYPVVAKFFLQHRGFEINTFSRRQVGVFTNETGLALFKLQNEYEELLVHLDIVC